jgi:hypothetical protein
MKTKANFILFTYTVLVIKMVLSSLIDSIKLLWNRHDHEDLDLMNQLGETNLYKRDLLKCMHAIDDYESSNIGSSTYFVNMIRRIGLIVYMAGPAITKVSVDLIEPLVALYDNDGLYGKDVKVATLSVLSTILQLNAEHQEKAAKAELHMAILDELEQYTYGLKMKLQRSLNARMSQKDKEKNQSVPKAGRRSESRESQVKTLGVANSNAAKPTKSTGSVFSFFKTAPETSDSMTDGNPADKAEDLTSDEETLTCWMIYTLKTMCLGAPAVITEVTNSVENRKALKELLHDAGELIDWSTFCESAGNQAEALIKILGLGQLDTIEEAESDDGEEDGDDGPKYVFGTKEQHAARAQQQQQQQPPPPSVQVPTPAQQSGFDVPVKWKASANKL